MPGASICNQITHHNNSAYKEHVMLIFEPVRNLDGYPGRFLKKIDIPSNEFDFVVMFYDTSTAKDH